MKEDNRYLVVEAFNLFRAKVYVADVMPTPLPSSLPSQADRCFIHVSRGLSLESPETSGATIIYTFATAIYCSAIGLKSLEVFDLSIQGLVYFPLNIMLLNLRLY